MVNSVPEIIQKDVPSFDADGNPIIISSDNDEEIPTTKVGEIGEITGGELPYITFTGESSDFTLKATNKSWDGTVEYSTDKTTWTTWDGSEISSSNQNLYLRGSGNNTFYVYDEEEGYEIGVQFVLSSRAGCYGNINTLLQYDNPPTTLNTSCYQYMFQNCTSLTTAPALPATTLANYCYAYMFYGCTGLTTPPALPATTLATYCYRNMFYGCTNLTTPPELPATTLATYCYYNMFRDCTSLITPPALPATTLANYCYQYMFRDCTSLITPPALPATTLADYCYQYMFTGCTNLTTAPALPATTLANYCYAYMFYGCTGLTTPPALPATTLANYCYYNMFRDCTSLITPPELPATTLATYCYYNMFRDCTSLITPPALPATTLANYCYQYMFYGCTGLTTPPALPATTLATYCYRSMFYGCTNLTTPPELPATTLANYCYAYMFRDCTSLITPPALPATTLADYCYYNMFYGCSSLKVSSSQSGTYQYAWRIPTSGTISSTATGWNTLMLSGTGGTFTSNPSINTTYYVVDEDPTTTYTITANILNGTASSSNPTEIEEGGTATLTFTANDGYELPNSISFYGGDYTWDKSTGTLTISNPTDNINLVVTCSAKSYNIISETVSTDGGSGTISVPASKQAGSSVTLSISYSTGSKLSSLEITTSSGNSISYIYNGDNKYTFTMPFSDVNVKVYFSLIDVAISATISNGVALSSNPTLVKYGQNAELTFTPNTGYTLPDVISVSGAEYAWDKDTGKVILLNVVNTTGVTISCVAIVYTITTKLVNCTANENNPTTITYPTTATLQFVSDTAYNLPLSILVTGAQYNWDNTTGILSLFKPTADVYVEIDTTLKEDAVYIILYQNTAEGNRVDKTLYLDKIGVLSGYFRDGSSITNISFVLQLDSVPNFNYVYIPLFNRYYYVTDITTVTTRLWEISLSVDVLMSYKDALLGCEAFVDRNENVYNELIVDDKTPLQQGQTVTTTFIDNDVYVDTTGQFVLTGLLVSIGDSTSTQSLDVSVGSEIEESEGANE